VTRPRHEAVALRGRTIGLDVEPPPTPVTAARPIADILEACLLAEAGFQMAFGMVNQPAETRGVSSTVETITGSDGNEITLYVHRPDQVDTALPCVVHTHGGDMAILTAADPGYGRWRDMLAATGLVGVEFRNAGGTLGPHPFPAGLNDCASAAQWVIAHRELLGVPTIVISGESGGGNLAIASALEANRGGWIDGIDGVSAQCPYSSGGCADPPAELTSLFENGKYLLDVENMWAMAKAYDPDGADASNPLAWPMHASATDLTGLPPHAISVNELDPLRDEVLVYFRKLVGAGVSAVSRTVNGTCHAGDCLFVDAMPDVVSATIRDIKGFAESL
jgi:acetyl esterase